MTERNTEATAAIQEAAARLAGLPPAEREALLIKCWMSHDARWFMAVAGEFGLEAANRVNLIAAREVGRVEAQRIARAAGRPPVRTARDYAAFQEAAIGVLGPDLLDYEVTPDGEDALRFEVRRCFAYDNVTRAGVAPGYRCGIFARMAGWLDALGLGHDTEPPVAGCLKAAGRECAYTVRIRPPAQSA